MNLKPNLSTHSVITKNKHLMTTTKKLQDLLDEIDEKTIEDFYD